MFAVDVAKYDCLSMAFCLRRQGIIDTTRKRSKMALKTSKQDTQSLEHSLINDMDDC